MKTYILNEEQKMIVDLAKSLAEAEVKPRSERVDHEAVCPTEGVAVLAKAGLVACMVPEELGGAGLDHWSQIAVLEAVAKECASTAWTISNIVEVAECLNKHGTDLQKEQILAELPGGVLACVAGSDAPYGAPKKFSVTAKKAGVGFVLNGAKKNVPHVGSCKWYLVAANGEDGPVWVTVNADAAGVKAQIKGPKLGMRGCCFGELVFENCEVAADMVLSGDVSATLSAVQALDMAAIAEGIAQGAIQEATQYINQRVQFGKTIAQFENTQHIMAKLLAETEAARALVWQASHVKDSGDDYAYAAALAKLAATDAANVVTRKCIQFMGGYGYSREYPVERKMRDAKMTELLGGASCMQKDIVAQTAVVQ